MSVYYQDDKVTLHLAEHVHGEGLGIDLPDDDLGLFNLLGDVL